MARYVKWHLEDSVDAQFKVIISFIIIFDFNVFALTQWTCFYNRALRKASTWCAAAPSYKCSVPRSLRFARVFVCMCTRVCVCVRVFVCACMCACAYVGVFGCGCACVGDGSIDFWFLIEVCRV